MTKDDLSHERKRDWRPLVVVIAILVAALFLASFFLPAEMNSNPNAAMASNTYQSQCGHSNGQKRIVENNVPYVVQDSTFATDWQNLGPAPGDTDMVIELYLGLHNVNILEQYVNQVNNPYSTLFHHYLSPAQFQAKFYPPASEINHIESYYENAGFSVWSYDYAPTVILLEGNVSLVNSVFNIQENYYNFIPEDTVILTNTVDPSVPAQFSDIFHIYGLSESYFLIDPTYANSEMLGTDAQVAPTGPAGDATTLTPTEIASYYQLDQLFAKGYYGQNTKVGIIGIFDCLNISSVDMFWDGYGIQHPTVNTVYLTDNGQCPYSEWLGEADLDVEWIGAMAPESTIYYVMLPWELSESGDVEVSLEFYYMLNVLDPNIVSCGYWFEAQFDYDASFAQMYTFMGLQAAAEGITVFTATGDSHSQYLLNAMDSSYFVSVGDVWADLNDTGVITYEYALYDPNEVFFGGLIGSGGGNSYFFEKPAYQKKSLISVPCSYNMRALPDIAMPADYLITTFGDQWYTGAGGAYAVPISAGMFATIESGLGCHHGQSERLGWIQSTLYNLGYGTKYGFHAYHDISYLYPGDWSTQPVYLGHGWNEWTGIGSIQAYNLYRDIARYNNPIHHCFW